MEVVAFFAIFIYAAFYYACSFAIRLKIKQNLKLNENVQAISSLKTAIIVPYHNEVDNLQSLLVSIAEQSKLPHQLFLINDHSTDNSLAYLKSLLPLFSQLPIHLLSLNEEQKGKKAALTLGIETCAADIVITTDADCTFSEKWIETIVRHFENVEADMVCGAVAYNSGKTWIEQYQKIESRALVNTGEAMHFFGLPVMCNGANLAFKKTVWQGVNGYQSNIKIASGDDIFLMHEFYKRDKHKVHFLTTPNNTVFTKPTKGVSKFLAQRKRWLSKNGKYQFWWANLFPIFIALLNLAIVLSVFYYLWHRNWWLAMVILIVKNVADFFIVNVNNPKPVLAMKILLFQPWQWLYPLILPFVKSDWKR